MSQPTQSAHTAIVASRWHAEIVDEAVNAFVAGITAAGHPQPDVVHVPGAFEIPLAVKRLALCGRYAAVAASGLVVDGGIYRHEFVASAVIDGLMRVQLESDVPVLSGVLTPHHFHEHAEHVEYFTRHLATKGAELADAAIGALAVHAKAA